MDFYELILAIPALMVSLAFHEYAHALAADRQGDPTPRNAGRLTLNPLAHIDPIGLIVFWLFRFGWAKPVPINTRRFRNQQLGTILVSIAGPAANFMVAFLSLLIFRTGLLSLSASVDSVLILLVLYNVSFGVFNLIPIPPLDGSHVLKEILGEKLPALFRELDSFGMLILLVIVWTGLAGRFLVPAVNAIIGAFDTIIFSILIR